jgi:transcriptional regulator with XRE-family HTH domain
MQNVDAHPMTSWRAWRETIAGLTMNEVARRSGITSGRLSIIERGVPPTAAEAASLRAVLIAASQPAGEVIA